MNRKNKWVMISIVIIMTIAFFIPFGKLYSQPGNLVTNGDFSNGLDYWDMTGSVSEIGGSAYLEGGYTKIEQDSIYSNNKNLILGFSTKPVDYNSGGILQLGFNIYKNGSYIDSVSLGGFLIAPLNK